MDGANSRDRELRARAEAVIPGGMYGHQSTGLLPDDYPQYFSRGEGAHIWDADGRRYLDLMCAYGPNLFGYANPQIDAAYVRQLGLGDTLTGPTALMVELAEAFVGMVGHADWAMFCKNGTDATTMALSTARAHTRRKKVVRAKGAYHGAAPWCVPRPAGTIDSDRANQIFCDYNDVASLEAAVAEAGDDLACIFAAPFKHDAFIDQAEPNPAYARRARELCDATGALLVVDDVRALAGSAADRMGHGVGVGPVGGDFRITQSATHCAVQCRPVFHTPPNTFAVRLRIGGRDCRACRRGTAAHPDAARRHAVTDGVCAPNAVATPASERVCTRHTGQLCESAYVRARRCAVRST